MLKAFEKIGKELQKPEERQQEKNQFLERAQKLQQEAVEILSFFNNRGAESQKINNIQGINSNVDIAIQAINSWQPLIHSNENKDQVLSALNRAEQELLPFRQEMEALKQHQSKTAKP